MKDKTPRVERGIIKLVIPYQKGEMVIAWPSKGPSNYQKVGNEILNDKTANLRLQNGYETSLLVKTAYNSKEPEFQDVKDKIDKRYLWIYHVDFWLPEKDKNSGVYSVYDSKALGRNMEFNQEELEEMLKDSEVYQGVRINRDNKVAFAPRNTIYLGKETDWNKFKINGENIAIFSPEGSENLAEFGKKHFKYGYNWGVTGNDKVKTKVSALLRYWYLDNGRLDVNGNDWDDDDSGHAFGVCTDAQDKQ